MTIRQLTHLLSVTLLASCLVPRAFAQAQPGDLETLLEGVSEIGVPGVPGSLSVYGNQAFPVIVGASTSGTREPVVAAGRLLRGRVVAFGHDGYLTKDLSSTADTQRFLANVVRWAVSGKPNARVGVVSINGLATRLQAMGFAATNITFGAFAGYDLVIPNMGISRTRAESDLLVTYVRDGGGVIAGMTGWGWAQINSSLSLAEDFSGNWLMSAAGSHSGMKGCREKTHRIKRRFDFSLFEFSQFAFSLFVFSRLLDAGSDPSNFQPVSPSAPLGPRPFPFLALLT